MFVVGAQKIACVSLIHPKFEPPDARTGTHRDLNILYWCVVIIVIGCACIYLGNSLNVFAAM